jgi:hypothetical protein
MILSARPSLISAIVIPESFISLSRRKSKSFISPSTLSSPLSKKLSGTVGSSGDEDRRRALATSRPYLMDSARRNRMRPEESELDKSVA